MNRKQQIFYWLKEILKVNLVGINYRAFIFGSQANINELKRADIDLGILGDQPISVQQLSKINESIENLPMLYNIDVVDFNEVDDRFKNIALKNTEWL